MNSLALKVDRVANWQEVARLVALGVDYIGFDLDADELDRQPRFADERAQAEWEIEEIVDALGSAQGVALLSGGQVDPSLPERLASRGIKLIQIGIDTTLDRAFLDAAADAGLQIIYSEYIGATDPRDLSVLLGPDRASLAFYVIEVFPTWADAWAVVTGDERDKLRFGELNALGAAVPLFVSLNTTASNVGDIVARLTPSAITGLSFTLADAGSAAVHTSSFDELVGTLEALRA